MKKNIILRRQPQVEVSAELKHLPLTLQKILAHRGICSKIETEHDMINLPSFAQMLNIDKAVQLIVEAIEQQKRILIVGDFDADGATSTSLGVSALKAFGAEHVDYIVPNRFEYGYGLTPEIVDVARKRNPELLITVDNGISSIEGVAYAKKLGIQVLVTDHHLPGRTLPEADAIVNPNQPGDVFPSKNLAGVGVIFYVFIALRNYLREKNWFATNGRTEPNMAQFLDLVALGTVADVVGLDHLNRILVEQGMKRIRNNQCRPGITALLTIAKREQPQLVAADLGFAVGPRLNAAGRLDDMSLGIECLLATDYVKALQMAKHLNELNVERRQIEEDMQQQALQDLKRLNLEKSEKLPRGLCIYDANWHQGVIGILASRIKDRFHRPVIAFAAVSDTEIKGSARSVTGVHIRDVLDAVASKNPGLITKFGGHAMAAGLSLVKNNYERFAEEFNAEVSKYLAEEDLQGILLSDGELAANELNLDFAHQIRNLGPWGQNYPEPLFDGIFSLIDQRIVGNKHLKLTLGFPGVTKPINAIAFNINLEEWPNHRAEKINIAYRLDVNYFQNIASLQLMVEQLEMV